MVRSRQDVEEELDTFNMKHQAQEFLDFCEEEDGDLDMPVADTVQCGIGTGSIDLSKKYEDSIEGDLTVVSYRPGRRTTTVQHWANGKHISNTYLENADINSEGNLSGELGDISAINIRSGARK